MLSSVDNKVDFVKILSSVDNKVEFVKIPSSVDRRTYLFNSTSNIKMLQHPPYTPDLAPYDFWLCPKLKKELAAGREFHVWLRESTWILTEGFCKNLLIQCKI